MTNLVFFPNIPDRLKLQTHYWKNLPENSIALALSNAAVKWNRLTVCVTPNSQINEQLLQELTFFTPSDFPVFHLPDWEILPYDHFSPHQDIISERLHTLHQLLHLQTGLLVIPITTLMQRLAPREFLHQHSLLLKQQQKINLAQFRHQLIHAGYRSVETVYEHGEFASRGSVIDIFPMGSNAPYRIDLFDDAIESLRIFDSETQCTVEKIEQIKLIPAKEFPLDDLSIRRFQQQFSDQFDVHPKHCPIYQDISQKIPSAGIEFYQPLFFDKTETLFDYLPKESNFFLVDDISFAANHYWQQINMRFESLRGQIERPLLPPEKLFLTENAIFSELKKFPKIATKTPISKIENAFDFEVDVLPKMIIDHHQTQPFNALISFLNQPNYQAFFILFCVESLGRRESLLQLLKKIDIKPNIYASWQECCDDPNKNTTGIIITPVANGAIFNQQKLILITENELFGRSIVQRSRKQRTKDNTDLLVKSLTELKVGDPVVHEDHGVGRYLGLQTLDVDNLSTEFLSLEYADEAKLYVPVSSLHLISRYAGVDKENAPLNRLGSEQWSRAKRKAMEKIHDTAAELLDIYAKRGAKQGYRYAINQQDYNRFCQGFPFETTEDQQKAIDAVLGDMQKSTPIDRLICGDVGFGKTEVALRATFIAVANDKQVAILVPTTLLAEQHYERLTDRFADWPVRIAAISRFKSPKEQQAILNELESGTIDIVIGTHKLLQANITFKRLGLLIIDEEHRFGVRQKEKIKALRSDIDIITLTATPIPRTLNFALSGLRDLSIIATPPERRLAVKTFVSVQNDDVIREAIQRELLRGGQIYYLHNDVKNIEKTSENLRILLPDARIGVAHGQLPEKELERVMSEFYHKRFNVLVCSTIIETGIDIPSANTILIERADKFGLAQLHQLRGRVGRSHHQAYAYLFTPEPKAISSDARKRLQAIAETQDLGAGFTLATHDLEIRGTGELLGDEQSGHIHTIGFQLYMELLDRAIESIKSGKSIELSDMNSHKTDINLRICALIPETFIPDVHMRLTLYKRIANAGNEVELDSLHVEMIDRFGLLPQPVEYLFKITYFKLIAQALGIEKIEANQHGARLLFIPSPKVDPNKLISMVQSNPSQYRFQGAEQFKLIIEMASAEERLKQIDLLLTTLNTST